MKTKTGTLYGIGVGPGDPDLLTMKAVKILSRVDIVFAAASTKNTYSLAVDIAKPHIPESASVQMLQFPMTREKKVVHQAWKDNARIILDVLETGKHAAFLTLGDSLTYSTYGYVLKYILAAEPGIHVQTIPGITSYQAAAARLNMPLVEGEESLMVVSGATGGDRLRELSERPENVVFLKAYRNIKDIKAAIDESGQYLSSVGIKNCGQAEEEIIPDIAELGEEAPNYWTLIIAKQNTNNVPKKD